MTAEEKFWYYASPGCLPDDCWAWAGATNSAGYSKFFANGRHITAHRFSYALHHKETAKFVCHRCDNPRCSNPVHLFAGTAHDNKRDSMRKGRHAHGNRHGNAKLTAQDVIQIRRLYENKQASQVVLATQFGVHQAAIAAIVVGRNWKTAVVG